MYPWKNTVPHILRNLSICLLLGLAFTCFYTQFSRGQWQKHMQQGRSLFMDSQFQQAEEVLRTAKNDLGPFSCHSRKFAETSYWLGLTLAEEDKFSPGRVSLLEALNIFQTNGQALEAAACNAALGQLYENFGHYLQAQSAFEESWKAVKPLSGSEAMSIKSIAWWHLHSIVCGSEIRLRTYLSKPGATPSGFESDRAPDIDEKSISDTDPLAIPALLCLACMNNDSTRPPLPATRAALARACRLALTVGGGIRRTRFADCLMSASALNLDWQPEEAAGTASPPDKRTPGHQDSKDGASEALHEAALRIYLANLGEQHFKTMQALDGLARDHQDKYPLEESGALFERALSIAEQFEPWFPNGDLVYEYIVKAGAVYEALPYPEPQERIYRKAFAHFERRHDLKYMIGIGTLSRLHGLNKLAETLLQQCVDSAQRISPPNPELRQRALNELAQVHERTGKFDQAGHEFKLALEESRQAAARAKDPSVIYLEPDYVELLVNNGKLQEAQNLVNSVQAENQDGVRFRSQILLSAVLGHWDEVLKRYKEPGESRQPTPEKEELANAEAAVMLMKGDRGAAARLLAHLYRSGLEPITVLNNLAICSRDNNRQPTPASKLLIRSALGSLSACGQGRSVLAAGILNNMANCQASDQSQSYDQALDILKSNGCSHSVWQAVVLNNQACFSMGQMTNGTAPYDPARCEFLLRKAACILEEASLKDHPYYACVLNNLGRYCCAERRTQEGHGLKQKAAAIILQARVHGHTPDECYPGGLIDLPFLPERVVLPELDPSEPHFWGSIEELWRVVGDV